MPRAFAFAAGMACCAAFWFTSATAFAQFPRGGPADAGIVSGNDIGFRIEGTDPRTGAPTGTWVLWLKGKWVAIGSTPTIKPAK